VIVSIVNLKGGVGKTTITVNLAGALLEAGLRVILLDTDPQGSVLQWRSIEASFSLDVIHHPLPVNTDIVSTFSKGNDFLIFDTPPASGPITRSVVDVSDLAIIPVTPSPLDIWSSRETLDMVESCRQKRKRPLAALLISRKIPGTRVGREARDALESYRLPIFTTEITQRVAYVEAMIAGVPVTSFSSRSEAASEVRSLCAEVRGLCAGLMK
jgi:chromosome partitioning protein